MTDFGRATLPYCSFVLDAEDRRRVGVGVETVILDLSGNAATVVPDHAALFADGGLDLLLAAGPKVWDDVRTAVAAYVDDDTIELVPRADVELVLPFAVADFVDFYASEHHATNMGRLFRPDGEALTPNWKHLPIGYHGRAGTVVPSETTIRRPAGQRRSPTGEIGFGPSAKLDIAAEIGFVVGVPSSLGEAVPTTAFDQHVFGVCIVNDWSARDIQAWEYVPLGPFLGKSFATSVSPWVVPLAALEKARVEPPTRTTGPFPYLLDAAPWGLDLELVVSINGTEVSRPPFDSMYWTPAQMLAHLTVNGASLRTGDLFASGTVSGPHRDQCGSLLELSWNGTEPFALAYGTTRTFLEDGDTVTISAYGRSDGERFCSLGDVTGTIAPARTRGDRRALGG